MLVQIVPACPVFILLETHFSLSSVVIIYVNGFNNGSC